jgi:hypothetical protein
MHTVFETFHKMKHGTMMEKMKREESEHISMAVDPSKNRFPFCLVWGPLPPLTWLVPFIGHMGIADSSGRIHDFAGPYTISIDDFMVGKATMYLQMNPEDFFSGSGNPVEEWDRAISKADGDYRKMMHLLLWYVFIVLKMVSQIESNNCHHHASRALCHMGRKETAWSLWFKIMTKGKYAGIGAVVQTWCGFLVLIVVIGIIFLSKS